MTPFRYNSRSIHVLAESCHFPHVTAQRPKIQETISRSCIRGKGRRPFRAEQRTLFRKTSQWVILALSLLADLLLALIILDMSELMFFRGCRSVCCRSWCCRGCWHGCRSWYWHGCRSWYWCGRFRNAVPLVRWSNVDADFIRSIAAVHT